MSKSSDRTRVLHTAYNEYIPPAVPTSLLSMWRNALRSVFARFYIMGGTGGYVNIPLTIFRSSSLFGKNNSYLETNRLLSMPYVAYSTISSSL